MEAGEMTERSFSLQELAEYDGRDGGESFFAFEGKVYDVTDSPMWIDGDHEGEHAAGEDLTAAMADAPHGVESFAGFPAVGVLAE
jgi:predicted heme/steroid binding protein